MTPSRLLPLLLVLAACTKDNPRACAPGDPCTDPAFPFCDLDGIVGGLPGDCLAVDCTPGDFVACNADQALQCNAFGDNYDSVLCQRGCDPLSDGCRLCNPNETACTNGITATCDASGAVVEMTPCPLGCFESEPRCRQVDPSNGLAMYLDSASDAIDVTLPGGTVIDTLNGTITPPDSGPLPVASFLVPAPADGVPTRVFVVGSWTSADLYFVSPQQPQTTAAPVIVSARDVRLEGEVFLSTASVNPGSLVTGACVGDDGSIVMEPSNRQYSLGGGGGGYATSGARGGRIDPLGAPSNDGGAAFENPDLIPLRGGCAGGMAFSDDGGSGGGAIQIVSGTRITVDAAATINANGQSGSWEQSAVGGGGSGGGLLLEAPVIEIGDGARLMANGGGGMAGDTSIAPPSLTLEQTPDTACMTPSTDCGAGGAGGAGSTPPRQGQDLIYSNATNVYQATGGAGGAVGYIRINTATGSAILSTSAVVAPLPSTGQLQTR